MPETIKRPIGSFIYLLYIISFFIYLNIIKNGFLYLLGGVGN